MEQLKNLENPNISDEQKLKLVNEISETFDSIISGDGSQAVVECYLNVFINYLKNTQYQFFSESPSQKVSRQLNADISIRSVYGLILHFSPGAKDYSGDDSPPSGVGNRSPSCQQHPNLNPQLDKRR